MSHMLKHFVLRPIYILIPISNRHLYVRVVLLNIHTSFIFMQYDLMHEDSLTPYKKYTDNRLSSEHNSFRHFTCYYKTSKSFVIHIRHSSSIYIIYVVIIQHYTTSSLRHLSTLYNIVITQHRP